MPSFAASKKRSRSQTTGEDAASRKRARQGHTVSVNELNWKPVSMPDRLDDVEGFYGLEEVDGVDVDHVEGGKITFKVSDKPAKSKKSKSTKAGPDNHEESEWNGFSDTEADSKPKKDNETSGDEKEEEPEEPEEPAKGEKKSAKSVRLQKKNEKQRERQKAKKKKAAEAAGTGPAKAPENPFEALAEEAPTDDIDLPEWESLGLSLPTLQALSKLSFNKPTQIQSSAIPPVMAGQDVIGKASTGSGKTLAFGIPILEAYLAQQAAAPPKLKEKDDKKEKAPLALILAPTRELAHQLHAHLTALAAFTPDCNIVALTGGISLQKQQRQLQEHGGADIIIATPGRLWEIVSEGQGWIDRLRVIKFLVVDEADRLLQEGHFKEVEDVLDLLSRQGHDAAEESESESESDESEDGEADKQKKTKRKPKKKQPKQKEGQNTRQTLVFSATFHQGLQQKLSAKGKKAWRTSAGGDLMDEEQSMAYLLKKLHFRSVAPAFIDANPAGQLADQLREGVIECGPLEKDLYLYYLLLRYPCRTLVFTNSISAVKRLAPFLSTLALPAHPFHSSMEQKARLRNLERFSAPDASNAVLVATDVAARGLDIKGVEMVVHYHLPRTADMYVHRSGRTARADARGISVLLCAPEEVTGVRRLVGKVHGGEGRYAMRHFEVDRQLVARIKRRVELAKKLTESGMEKQRKGKEDEWLKSAAEELGVDYDSEEFAGAGKGRRQRGVHKKKEAASVTKGEMAAWRAELKALLAKKINAGFSTRYLTAGGLNLAQALLERDDMHEQILGVEKKSAIDEVAW